MAYILAVDSGESAVSQDFDPPVGIRLKAKITLGLPLTEEEQAAVPKVLRVSQRRRGGIPAILGWITGPFIVCELLKEKLESLEPGIHSFMPIEIFSAGQHEQEKSYGIYYWILSPPRLNAVIIEETTFTKGVGRAGYELSGGRISSSAADICVVDGDVIAGHHLWQLPSDFGATKAHPDNAWVAYFCSDELRDFIKSNHLDGWDFIKKCVEKKD